MIGKSELQFIGIGSFRRPISALFTMDYKKSAAKFIFFVVYINNSEVMQINNSASQVFP
jgi:hypothetical protein